MRNARKNVTKIGKKVSIFFPYMRRGWKNVTKTGIKLWPPYFSFWPIFSPLYAIWVKKRDNYCPKMTHNFPLYAEMARICDRNCRKMIASFDAYFYLICNLVQNLRHKWLKIAHILTHNFTLYAEMGRKRRINREKMIKKCLSTCGTYNKSCIS